VDVVLFDDMFEVFLHSVLKVNDLLLGLLGFVLKLFNLSGQDDLDFLRGNSDSLHGGYDSSVD
jgi:hypothetical protein